VIGNFTGLNTDSQQVNEFVDLIGTLELLLGQSIEALQDRGIQIFPTGPQKIARYWIAIG